MSNTRDLTVFYDGSCPLCEREIAFYRRRRGAQRLNWIDVSGAPDGEVAPGLSKDQALSRFHVMTGDESLISGGEAFARLWAALPGFRMLGRVLQVPPLAWIVNRAYDLFLVLRPRLQAFVRARG